MENSQTTLRDALNASFDQVVETSTPNQYQAASIEGEAVEVKSEKPRDDQGKFVAKEEKPAELVEAAPVVTQPEPEKPTRPTTWKKEYLPIWDKLSTGQALTPEEATKLAAYSQQRENEYKTGVSTYRAEAQQAKELQEAIAPFIPDLQAEKIPPAQFIRNLGNAHVMLTKGTPEQKINLFAHLARPWSKRPRNCF